MKTLFHKTILALVAALSLVTLSASVASADGPKALLFNPNPGPDFCLPKFGFDSFNIQGVGDRVTHVQWGGLAAQMGLEPGDTILNMNGFPLSYHGAWNDALLSALQNGGWVQLTIRDVHTGWLAQRQLFVGNGGYGPITQKFQVTNFGPNTSKIIVGNGGFNGGFNNHPIGPITTKKLVGPQNPGQNNQIKKIVKLLED